MNKYDFKDLIIAEIERGKGEWLNDYTAAALLGVISRINAELTKAASENPNMTREEQRTKLTRIFCDVLNSRHMEKNYDGYGEYVIPLSREKALKLYDGGWPVYLIYPDSTESLAEERTEIENGSYFGMETDIYEDMIQHQRRYFFGNRR